MPESLQTGGKACLDEEYLEHKQGGGLLESNACNARNNVCGRLGELHTNILGTARVVEQVHKEFLRLQQENEKLRRKLSVAGSSVAGGEEPPLPSSVHSEELRSSARPSGEFIGKDSNWPATPASFGVLHVKTDELGTVVGTVADRKIGKDQSLKVPVKDDKVHKTSSLSCDSYRSASLGWEEMQSFNDQHDYQPSRADSFAVRMTSTATERVIRRTHNKAGTMLIDHRMVKEQLKKNIIQQEFNVAIFYHKEGYAQSVAKSSMFENISLAVICLNTLFIAIDTEHNRADVLLDADIGFQIVEHMFCCFFFLEILIRFAAFEVKCNCLRSGWFIFDSLLACFMVFEDWIMTVVLLARSGGSGGESTNVSALKNTAMLRVLRLARLARLGRVLKLMRQSPEVMVMVKAMTAATRCVLCTSVLIAGIMFFFAVSFTQLCKETGLEDEHFPSLTGSLHTLLISAMFPDLGDVSRTINRESVLLWLMFVGYITMTTICVLNLLIGVLVEIVKGSSMIERDAMDVSYVKQVFLTTLDVREGQDIASVSVSKAEFFDLLQDPDILKALTKVGIDVLGLVDLMDFIFMKGSLCVADLLETVLQLRSNADVTVKDVVEVRKFLTYEINNMKRELKRINVGVRKEANTLQTMSDALHVANLSSISSEREKGARQPKVLT